MLAISISQEKGINGGRDKLKSGENESHVIAQGIVFKNVGPRRDAVLFHQ